MPRKMAFRVKTEDQRGCWEIMEAPARIEQRFQHKGVGRAVPLRKTEDACPHEADHGQAGCD